MSRKPTQCDRILDYMLRFGSISTYEAFNDLGVTRLASRINDLKDIGFVINSEFETRKNRFGDSVSYKRYRLDVTV